MVLLIIEVEAAWGKKRERDGHPGNENGTLYNFNEVNSVYID